MNQPAIGNDEKESKEILRQMMMDVNSLNLKWKIGKLTPSTIPKSEGMSQDDLKVYYQNQIVKLQSKLKKKNITSDRKEKIDKYYKSVLFGSIITPVIVGAATVSSIVIYSVDWWALTINIFNVIFPFFLDMYKKKIEKWIEGIDYSSTLTTMNYSIEKLAKLNGITSEVQEELDAELAKIRSAIDKLDKI